MPLETFMTQRLEELIERLEREQDTINELIAKKPSKKLEQTLLEKRHELKRYRERLSELLERVEVFR
jgi:hypothetical protein